MLKSDIVGAATNTTVGFVYPGALPVYILDAETVAVAKTGALASNAESILVKVTDVKDGVAGETALIDKSDIVGADPNASTVCVYVGAKLDGSATTCEEIVGTAGVTAVTDNTPGSLSPKSPTVQ